MSFPVLSILPDLRETLRSQKVCIVQAPPGAGKSTVLPLELLNEPWLDGQRMIMLEPRRLATRSVAMRMASVLKGEIGDTVGYKIRFENRTSAHTRIEVVTEGVLTRLIQQDPGLDGVGLVIFDEFHERSLHADLALALCLQVQQLMRPDLRIMIMSATIDADKLVAKLPHAKVLTSEGKQFPVAIQYFPPEPNVSLIAHCVRTIRKAMLERGGDVLVFLPGTGEIRRVASDLESSGTDAIVFPLYGDLPFKVQQEAILPRSDGRRKIILATSIAETSLTIEGITIVVDTGYARVPRFNPRSGLTRLETVRVSRDAADQRAGRAGRLGPGYCYRLWSEGTQATLVSQRVPEILEADLAQLMLELASWGTKPNELVWMTPPPPGAVAQATDLLVKLGALSEEGRITSDGKSMLMLPTHPRLAHMMLKGSASAHSGAVALTTDIAAIIEEKDPLSREAGSDLALRVEALRAWRRGERTSGDHHTLERIEKIASVWRKTLRVTADNGRVDDQLAGVMLAAAFPERIARRMEKFNPRYKLANGRSARLPDNDPLMREQWICIADIDEGVGEGKIFLAAAIDEESLLAETSTQLSVRWDNNRKTVVATNDRRLGDFVISSTPVTTIPEAIRVNEIINAVKANGLKLLAWGEKLEKWQARIMSLRTWRPEEPWPDVSDETLIATADQWLTPFLNSVVKAGDIERLDADAVLTSLLPWELSSKVDRLAPSRLEVPSGSMIPLSYSANGAAPVMEVRLQEVFGLAETPSINEGRTRVLMHLLSPGYKPVQVTQDLKSFWNTTYAEVRKELRMRYPKHSWPEDPWTAEAVRGAKRRTPR